MNTYTYLVTTLENGENIDYKVNAESKRKATSLFNKSNPGKDVRSVIRLYNTFNY